MNSEKGNSKQKQNTICFADKDKAQTGPSVVHTQVG